MEQYSYFDETQRMSAAGVIEAQVVKLLAELNMQADHFLWNLNQGFKHSGPHRLDIHIADYVIKVYFTDYELASYWGRQDTTHSNMRLRELIRRYEEYMLATSEPLFQNFLKRSSKICASDFHRKSRLTFRGRKG